MRKPFHPLGLAIAGAAGRALGRGHPEQADQLDRCWAVLSAARAGVVNGTVLEYFGAAGELAAMRAGSN